MFCLVDEHDRYVVDDRVNAATRGASEAVLFFCQLDGFFAGGADEDIQQLL
ncbi:MAG TPA: hypothetical protein VNX88_07120 [Terriglobales bacterium]|nr:hypothetical protein [Terriglobales bacterium]